jgi:hypothetical protein
VSYADRHKFLYERHLAAKEKDLTATDEISAPALIALSLPHSQRADALGITQAIFSARPEYLTGVKTRSKIGIETRQPSTRLPTPEIIVRPTGVLAVYLLSTSEIDHLPRGGLGLYSDSGFILYLLCTNENFVTKFCVSHFSASAPTGERSFKLAVECSCM